MKCGDRGVDTLAQTLTRNGGSEFWRQRLSEEQALSFHRPRRGRALRTHSQMSGDARSLICGQFTIEPCLEGSFFNAIIHRLAPILPYVRVNSLRALATRLPT